MEKQIKLTRIDDIYDFVKAASCVESDVLIKKDKYIINGKSLMGLMSLDLSTGVTVAYEDDAFDLYLKKYSC